MAKRYQLSDSLVNSIIRHLSVIVDHVDDKGKPRIADTVRLAKKDLRRLQDMKNKNNG